MDSISIYMISVLQILIKKNTNKMKIGLRKDTTKHKIKTNSIEKLSLRMTSVSKDKLNGFMFFFLLLLLLLYQLRWLCVGRWFSFFFFPFHVHFRVLIEICLLQNSLSPRFISKWSWVILKTCTAWPSSETGSKSRSFVQLVIQFGHFLSLLELQSINWTFHIGWRWKAIHSNCITKEILIKRHGSKQSSSH